MYIYFNRSSGIRHLFRPSYLRHMPALVIMACIGQHVHKHVCTPLTDNSISLSMWNMTNMLQVIDCSNLQKEDEHIMRDIENALAFLNT